MTTGEQRPATGTLRVWLTQDAYDRLCGELARLRSVPTAADGGAESLEPDVEERHRRQNRIRELEALLHRAAVGETPPDDGIAEPGMVLTVRFDDDRDTETFLLGLRDGAEQDGLEVYSPDSPLGTALLGARQGEQRSYVVPSGATVRVTLIRAVPFGLHYR
ncbi:GreA/GreB family elongation factor [Prauserella muralis]|uniref:Transcription elongation factor GreAB n=1 Tax=Prauserella muralis TaxID=588067 RepID=A0A2V4B0W6_9PSEU|nr:GreA/GreB family elongation factor [Prauserella muralis]PXY27911.1 transcription elongation factor GreAB [Prauserella muralis]TWE22308.1 GreA/GreB family elongation factor [Prauserella muralis]